MDSPISSFLLLFPFSLLFVFGNSSDSYSSCSNLFNCGDIANVGFPFWGVGRPPGCGNPALQLACEGNKTTIVIMEIKYQILKFGLENTSQTLTIARTDYMGTLCPKKFINTTIDYNLFDTIPNYRNITLLYCSSSPIAGQFSCPGYNSGFIQGNPMGPSLCNVSVSVPVSLDFFPPVSDIVNSTEILKAIDEGFEVRLKEDGGGCGICEQSEGVCGYDLSSNRTTCYCRAGKYNDNGACRSLPAGGGPASSPGGNGSKKTSLIIGLSIGAATVLGLCLGCFVFYITQRKQKQVLKLKSKDLSSPPSSGGIPTPSTFRSNSIPSYPYSRSSLESRSSYFGAQVFTYAELEEATHNFDRSRELGDGGYGTVYFGTLKDGRIVAVKRLYENNYKRVEQFTNEVEILSKLQHPNLVKLYGSTSRHSQELLLVYEYISNGTVADHLHGKRANSSLLSWSVRLKIATETANALAYLHCNDIIHRDVKTNNILLDNNFKVKVADFGLSRLFPLDVTHVSTAPQGTPGYVDPEYYQCYQLTDKSDVYSFGVVLVELISSLQAVDINRNRNNINLSNMAIDRIQNHALSDLIDPDLGFERDYAVRSMIKSVAELAYRCLQQTRDVRPSMDEVLEILKGLENEELAARKAEVLDIGSDDVRLLRNTSSLLSSDSGPVTDKWVRNSIIPSS
ncbi:LEAF RUST 10 DISEASE-RESISTANCE LOCUS RECEPTOR-LIKE PROTEIN KINASE-like 1.4 isoform X3 [Benincasa hispida]|uniref:LEAF RUST 10 DISEASE-RESISTANCE LOCUS RECEPTOR-LIKE PROTEIN KINASE-like 1.4 isoform X3 n=1 Tax=Benincasa hispida TaxID=102211 RepID=UPI0019011BDC|nr:LEAF RUST 10 DISEASE-RESISTANCE LOCUS RECEPTOR-LIKE PROTEIN KINASE-like 1.4 isoform X3 [Benincasa hispida]XP_038894228.1 LEAF RUST 10 DISEASE-RESISTANCE LOCUS RECEPTOR-LIKE PROTEIN KINASE-like 1.4 isoform X3 [Benincasa hispida]